MKKILLTIAVLTLISPFVIAEESQTAAITRQAMLATKKALVAQNLDLTPEEEKVFWPAYDEYQIGINKMSDEYAALIKKFAVNFPSLTDDMARDLVDQYFKLEKDRISYRLDGVAKFRKIISTKKVMRFVQIENKLDASARADLAQQIPLAK